MSPPTSETERAGDAQTERLAKLAAFQLQMLRHAMKCNTLPFLPIFPPVAVRL